jgi:hypothetical protein
MPPKERPSLDCPPLMRGAEPLVKAGAITLLGEMHGTEQAPATLAHLACHATQQPEAKGVIVALEIPSDNAQAVQAFLASDGGEAARTALLTASHFTDAAEDGRDSVAIVGVLEQVRAWRSKGVDVELVTFDIDSTKPVGGSERDAKMAENLAAAIEKRAGATVLVLTGNIHNRTKKGTPWDAEFVPMGLRLRDVGVQLHTLDMKMSGGSMWVCMAKPGEKEPTCGERNFKGQDQGEAPFVEFYAAPDENGFDGFYYVGAAVASPPANPGPR